MVAALIHATTASLMYTAPTLDVWGAGMSHHAGGSQGGALQGITANFALVAAVAQKLGGVPLLMAEQADFAEHGPDAKATAMYLAHLCSRLLDLSQEDRAAHVMQRLWRQHRHRKPGRLPPFTSCIRVCSSSDTG